MGNTHRVVLAMLLVSLVTLGCQSESSSPLGGGERTITSAAFDLTSDAAIGAALDACNDNGGGQGTAGSTRFGNAIRKYDSGGGTSEMLTLLQWEYERVDEGKWVCDEQDFVDIMTAMVNRVDLSIPISFDGGLCTNPAGCTLVSNDGCTGILTPNPAAKTYYISFEALEVDPFVAKAPIYNSYPAWADVKVFDINGNVVTGADFTGNPATVAIVTEGEIPVVEAGLALGHLKNAGTATEHVEILPPGNVGLELTTCQIQSTADAGFFAPVAALFRVTPLYAAGTSTKGLLSSFSPVGPIDPESDTKVGIAPPSTTLNDLQSVTLTATVTGVDGVDTQGGIYTAAEVTAGDPLHFLIDGAALDPVVTDANGQATLTLTCGDELPFGEHVIDVQYHGTDIHAESATTDGDSPTGSATVNCATPFKLVNFDRDPNNNPLKNGEVVNETYASQGVHFCRLANGATQCSGNVFAVSDPNTGNFGSPPRVVSLSATSSPISSTADGWVRALFDTAQNEVCVAVFPTGTKKSSPLGAITARFTNGTSITVTGQGKLVCVAKGNGRNAPLIQSVEFSGANGGAARFDNLRFR